MKFIIGKKQEMTQIWQGDQVIAVTTVFAGPWRITQLKTEEKDGYNAVQLGFGERKTKNINKPQKMHLKKAGVNIDNKTTLHNLREFRVEEVNTDIELGNVVKVDTFEAGDKIQITGTSKGKGFQGVVKRHGFKGTNEQHGNKDQSRMPGSIGATGPAHVFKGTRMGGRTGGDKVTMRTLEIVQVDQENNILYIKGGIPGARNGLVLIAGEGELKITKQEKKEEVKKEETIAEKDKSAQSTSGAADESLTRDAKEATTPKEVEKEVIEAKEKVDAKKEESK